jgi:hypothetical protein
MEQSPSRKLTGPQLVKKFPAFCGNGRFITAFAIAPPPPVPLLIQNNPFHALHPTSGRSILILSSHLRAGIPSGLFPSGLPTKALYATLLSPTRATCLACLVLLDLLTRMFGEEYRS